MSSPEQGAPEPHQPEGSPRPEQEPTPYLRAARFAGEHPAGQAYFQLQDTISTAEPNDLSVYRLRLRQDWHVAVLGNPPPPELDARITAALAAGEPVTFPAEVVAALAGRRAQAIRHGPWTERHVRPGQPL